MKLKIILSFLAFALIFSVVGQKPTMELTFSAINGASYVQLDNIKVMNRTQGGDTVLYYPDTVLVLDYQVGITEANHEKTSLQVLQNYPNPVEDQTTITLYIPEKDKVDLIITNIFGRQFIHTWRVLGVGYHSFRFSPGIGNLFFFTAIWKGLSCSLKILHSASYSHHSGSLEYIGNDNSSRQLKTTEAVRNFSFTPGDELLYIGYSDILHSGMLDSPATSETFIFQFATNIPCPGTPIVTYEGQVYNTIQIFSQCWLKENLNVGTMISGTQNMSNNSVIEKYCYNNELDSCTKYGGLYQWDEMMQYTSQQGVQGICPSGWHLPTDEEWKILEGAVDSQYGIGDPEWDDIEWYLRGFDAGLNLKSTSGWKDGGNGTDLFGFSGQPGGDRVSGYFLDIGGYGNWWTSTGGDNSCAWFHYLDFSVPKAGMYFYYKYFGFNVRCLRDN
jgi:uncharacterized protein (TIGR02145 family)